jgi:hypothetical protein
MATDIRPDSIDLPPTTSIEVTWGEGAATPISR